LLAAVTPRGAAAQRISVDGRFSPAQTLVGPNYAIGANLGKQVGNNLFHSFGQFGLSSGESAAFSGPATINNVIGRVTGGNPSSINGRIQSNIAGANLYLINPSGILFGPNATVNVSGSFHASTADYLKMSDGARFQATNPNASTLSAAPLVSSVANRNDRIDACFMAAILKSLDRQRYAPERGGSKAVRLAQI